MPSSIRHIAVSLFLLFAMTSGLYGAAAKLETVEANLLVVGGTESGWAAAIQAARMDVRRIAMVLDGQWLGGQYTEQALACVDENKGVGKVGWGVDWHPMKRSFHRSGLFKELMDRIEKHNERTYGEKMPGRPYHGPSTFRPVEAESIFSKMLQPYVDSGQVTLYRNYVPASAIKDGDRLNGLKFTSLDGRNPDLAVVAKLTIDASDWGEAVQLSGAAYESGPDPQSRYGEPNAPHDLSDFPPNTMNPITWAMIIEQSDGPTPIPKPSGYDDRNYARTSRISLDAMKNLRWDRPVRLGSILHWPPKGKESPRQLSVYTVRRLIDGNRSRAGKTVILLNYMLGQDYPLSRLPKHVCAELETTAKGASQKNIVEMTRSQREIVFADARRHALGVLYHLQHFVHDRAQDKANSLRHFHLSSEFGTADSLPPKPYIRESLRLKAMYMMREQDGRNTDGRTKAQAREAFATVMYHDGIAAWQFHYDFHRTGRAYLKDEGDSGPWIDFEQPGRNTRNVGDRSVFPLRSLIPEKIDGLLGAQKNLGYSSIVSAAIRLHDQCIHIGQAAGATAAICLKRDIQPRRIPYDSALLEEVRRSLCGGTKNAVPMLLWPMRDLQPKEPCFQAVNLLAMRGALPIDRRAVDFSSEESATKPWREEVVRRTLDTVIADKLPQPPVGEMTRGEFALAWWSRVRQLPVKPLKRAKPDDADADGIADGEDALLFTPRASSFAE